MQGLPNLIVAANVRVQRAEAAVEEYSAVEQVEIGKTEHCAAWRQTGGCVHPLDNTRD